MYRVLLTLWVWTLSAGWAGAQASEVGLIGVFDPYADDRTQREATDRIDAAVRRSGHEPRWLSAFSNRLSREADRVLLRSLVPEAPDLLKNAQGFLEQGRPEVAAPLLDRVRSQLERAAPVVPVTSLREELAILEAWRGSIEGDEARVVEAIQALVAMGVTEVKLAAWPEGLRGWLEGAWEVARGAPSTLEVTAESRRATLRVNGRPMGGLPRTVDALPAGAHELHVRSADGRVGYARVEVAAGQVTEIEVELGAPSLGAVSDDPADRASTLRALMEPLGEVMAVDLIFLVGRLDDGRVVGQLYDPQTQAFGRAVQGDDPVSLWYALADDPLPVARRDPLPLAVSYNLALATALRLPPAPGLVPVDPMGPNLTPPRRGAAGRWAGIGAGVAAAIAAGVAMGVVWGRPAGPTPVGAGGGTVVIAPPR